MIKNLFWKVLGTKRLLETLIHNRYEQRRLSLADHMLHDREMGVNTDLYTNHRIILSLTTFGKRIYDVAFTIESIMQQSMKANKIILWLDYSFEKKRLPHSLERQCERGLEICYCDDIRSYQKLIPSLRCFPNDAIITIDDDALYDPDLLERLIVPYLESPQFIYCHRYHKMELDHKGFLLPYNKWDLYCKDEEPSHLNFATGVGGILYPPHSLDEEVLNESVFMDICKYADDVWFKAMAIKKGTKVKKVYTRTRTCSEYLLNESVQDVGLLNINFKGEMLNDKQLAAVFSKYDLYNIIK